MLWVKTVEVTRKWPDTVIITVHEYEPHALAVIMVDSIPQLYYMDREGEPFIKAEAGMDFDFPVITGLDYIDDPSERSASFHQIDPSQ